MPRKYKLNLQQVKVPRHIRSIRERYIEQYDSDSGSGETLDSDYSHTSDSTYDDSEYEVDSEESQDSEDSESDYESSEEEEKDMYIRRYRYTYKPNGVKLPRRFHSTMRY